MKVQNIRIGSKIEPLISCYILKAYTYWANEDISANETVTLGPFYKGKHESNLFSLIETCARMSEDSLRHKVVSHQTDYYETLGYAQWFEGWLSPAKFAAKYPQMIKQYGETIFEELYDKASGFEKSYPYAVPYDSSFPIHEHTPNGLMNYRVYYYDENGIKHNVEIDWE